jgi:VanZ family protein
VSWVSKSLRWLPVGLWMAVIFTLSHMPGPQSAETSRLVEFLLEQLGIDLSEVFGKHAVYVVRKTAHFTEYFILALLVRRALSDQESPRRQFLAWTFAFAFACSDEFHQLFIPRRTGTPVDVLIDGAGAGLALAVAGLFMVLFRRRKKAV